MKEFETWTKSNNIKERWKNTKWSLNSPQQCHLEEQKGA